LTSSIAYSVEKQHFISRSHQGTVSRTRAM